MPQQQSELKPVAINEQDFQNNFARFGAQVDALKVEIHDLGERRDELTNELATIGPRLTSKQAQLKVAEGQLNLLKQLQEAAQQQAQQAEQAAKAEAEKAAQQQAGAPTPGAPDPAGNDAGRPKSIPKTTPKGGKPAMAPLNRASAPVK